MLGVGGIFFKSFGEGFQVVGVGKEEKGKKGEKGEKGTKKEEKEIKRIQNGKFLKMNGGKFFKMNGTIYIPDVLLNLILI